MKNFEIFKPGRHTASSGATLDFTEDQLRAAVEAYDPSLHEAPIVVGHPRDNGPAYGWIKSLSFADGAIIAEPQQIDADFAEMVQAGRFKKRSASWYLPDSPNNPKPGTLYLRHVGFLGAQPPAVKGLKEIAFSDGEQGVVEFSDSAMVTGILALMMRRMRDFFIEEYGADKAQSVIPDFLVADIEAEARKPAEPDESETETPAMPAFNEGKQMTIDELKAQIDALTTERDALKADAAKAAEFAERESSLAAREAAVADKEAVAVRASVESRIEASVKDGRMLPASKKNAIDFAMALADGEAVIEFGEGDKVEKLSQREAYLRQLEAAPKVVNYGEAAPAGDAPPADMKDPTEIAEKARDLVNKAHTEGKALSYSEAVSQVMTAAAE
jgi:hypothetical protein